LKKTSELVEVLLIKKALQASNGRKSMAARQLGLTPSTLHSRISALADYL